MSKFDEMSALLQKGKAKDLTEMIRAELKAGTSASDILNLSLISAMDVVGEKFKRNEIFIPEVLIAARAMNFALAELKPYLQSQGVKPIGKAIICTVKGDMHDIGKNMVRIMLEGVGIECIDLGVDVDSAKIIDAIKKNKAQIVCLSALLTTTMPMQAQIIKDIEKAGLRDKVKIMVGGAPLTEQFAKSIGADAYTSDAASAAKVAKGLLQ